MTSDDYLSRRRDRVAGAWNLTDDVVLVAAGEPVPVPGGADQTYPFLSHSDYFYLTDREDVGGVVAFDPREGWVEFVPETTEAERVWEGRGSAPGTPLSQLPGWLAGRRGRPILLLGSPLPGFHSEPGRTAEVQEALTHARRPKDAVEIERMRRAVAATAAGFKVAAGMIRAGVSERGIQVEMEAAFLRAGGERLAFGTIVGAGSNSAVLHFSPSSRRISEGDTVLIDAGAEIGRYSGDVTRTYRAPGGDDGVFRDLYGVVLALQKRAVAGCVAGAEVRDLHLAAARDLAEGMIRLGLLKGQPDSLVEQDVPALFFPHGLGHLVGLGVRDASGYLPGRARSHRPGLSMLRTDLPLEPGYAITMEPGLYFIPAILNDPERRRRHRDAVNWERVEKLFAFGGIRIEDDVLVTTGVPDVLTAAVPKELEAI